MEKNEGCAKILFALLIAFIIFGFISDALKAFNYLSYPGVRIFFLGIGGVIVFFTPIAIIQRKRGVRRPIYSDASRQHIVGYYTSGKGWSAAKRNSAIALYLGTIVAVLLVIAYINMYNSADKVLHLSPPTLIFQSKW